MALLRSRMRRRAEALEGGAPCDLCGAVVWIGKDGRCLLGHHVGAPPTPSVPSSATAPEPLDDTLALEAFAVDPHAPAGAEQWDPASLLDDHSFVSDKPSLPEPVAHPQAAALFAEAGQVSTSAASVQVAPPPAAAVPPPPLAAAGGRPTGDSLAHPYDEVLGWDGATLPVDTRVLAGVAKPSAPGPSALDPAPPPPGPPMADAEAAAPAAIHSEFDPADDAGEVRSVLLRRASIVGGGGAVFAIAAIATIRMAL